MKILLLTIVKIGLPLSLTISIVRFFLGILIRSYLVMAIFSIVSIAIGHILGPSKTQQRTTLAMESAARHPGLALTIAVLNFNSQKILPVLIPYMIVFIVTSTVYLQLKKQH